jgi:hypothetical protein
VYLHGKSQEVRCKYTLPWNDDPVTPSKGTPIRPVRIEDGLWEAALAKAAEEETTVSEHLRAELIAWTGYDPGPSDRTGTK